MGLGWLQGHAFLSGGVSGHGSVWKGHGAVLVGHLRPGRALASPDPNSLVGWPLSRSTKISSDWPVTALLCS